MNVIVVQFDLAWEDRKSNFEAVRRLLSGVTIPAGSLIVLPEMFSTGFSMNVDTVAETKRSGTEKFLTSLSWQYESHVIGGLVTRDSSSGRGRNELAVFDPKGRPVALYQKNYTFSYTSESDYYLRGDSLALFKWHDFTVCPLICYDLRFPELFRKAVREGANLFTVSANWPDARIHHWKTLLDARAIENQAYVVGVNRTGTDPQSRYPGASRIVDHHGRIVEEAGDSEKVISAELDYEDLRNWRRKFPALEDMKE